MSEDNKNADKEPSTKDEIYFPDLAALYKELYVLNENTWAEVFKNIITKDTFVQTLDKTLDNYLSNEKIIRQNVDKFMERSAFPSKKDIARIAELIIAVEEKVEVLDYQLVDAVKSMADSMLAMVEAQKKTREEMTALRMDILTLKKNIEGSDKKTNDAPIEPVAKTTTPSKSSKKQTT